MIDVLVVINLILIAFGILVLPLISVYLHIRHDKSPAWIMYACLVTIALLLLDYLARGEWITPWTVPVQFLFLLSLIFVQHVKRVVEARKKESNDF